MDEKQVKEFLQKARKGTVLHTEIVEFNETALTVNVYYQGDLLTTGRCPMASVSNKKVDFEKDLVTAIGTHYHNNPEHFKQESALYTA